MSSTPASMLQIVSSGLQDRERLNAPAGKPSIHFYKSVMRKRTRWASQWIRVDFDNVADFGRTATVTLPIKGELITRATLVVELPDIYTAQINAVNSLIDASSNGRVAGPFWAWTNALGHAICSDVQMLIGDQIVDEFDSQHLEVLDELHRPVEHFDSTNTLIGRDPSTFSDQQTVHLYKSDIKVKQKNPQSVEIVFPFWWNKGPGPTALPIQALWKDKVQIKTTFRTMQQCVYTSTRINPLNPPLSPNQGAGPMPNIAGCGFFYSDQFLTKNIYNATSTDNLAAIRLNNPFNGDVLPGYTMPTDFHFTDAYWIVEYVSLEDREAAAYRMADLELPIVQHIPLPVVQTGGSETANIRMGQGGLVRDLTWVAQREDALLYNAYFLFSNDLGPRGANPCDIPWWPNAEIPDWNYGDGYIRPGFSDRRSDPILSARMNIRGLTRFEHESPAIFRSLIPALNCKRTPLIDRYIYRYDFGFWPSGGLAEALYLPADEIRGYANWDKLPRRELALTLNRGACTDFDWTLDTTQNSVTITGQTFEEIDTLFDPLTDALRVELYGAQPDLCPSAGKGAVVEGIIDLAKLRRRGGYRTLVARNNKNGSSSILLYASPGLDASANYEWIAVAGSGGYGTLNRGGGGNAGDATEIGWLGGNTLQGHDPVDLSNGRIAYSSLNTVTNDLYTLDTSYNNFPGFCVWNSCRFLSATIAFSITTSSTQAKMLIKLHILTPDKNEAAGSPYTLKAPQSTTYVPLKMYTLVTETSARINIQSGFFVYISVETVLNPGVAGQLQPFDALVVNSSETPRVLACKVVVNPTGGSSGLTNYYGGGGGGRLSDEGVGLTDGTKVATDFTFLISGQKTGGVRYKYHGGDGYYGGGSGNLCGGGGGSYVSDLIDEVTTYENPQGTEVKMTLTPLKRVPAIRPSFNIYGWITRYNRLRINSGRGGLMFNETA